MVHATARETGSALAAAGKSIPNSVWVAGGLAAVLAGITGGGIALYNTLQGNDRANKVVSGENGRQDAFTQSLTAMMDAGTATNVAAATSALKQGDTATAVASAGQLSSGAAELHSTANSVIDGFGGHAQNTGNAMRTSDGTLQGGALTTNRAIAQQSIAAEAGVNLQQIGANQAIVTHGTDVQASVAKEQVGVSEKQVQAQAALAAAVNPNARDVNADNFRLNVGNPDLPQAYNGAPNNGSTQDALSGVAGGNGQQWSNNLPTGILTNLAAAYPSIGNAAYTPPTPNGAMAGGMPVDPYANSTPASNGAPSNYQVPTYNPPATLVPMTNYTPTGAITSSPAPAQPPAIAASA